MGVYKNNQVVERDIMYLREHKNQGPVGYETAEVVSPQMRGKGAHLFLQRKKYGTRYFYKLRQGAKISLDDSKKEMKSDALSVRTVLSG